MAFLNTLLNLLGLGFWLAWRGPGLSPVRPAGTLVGNLRPAQVQRRRSPAAGLGLLAVLVCRPWVLSMLADAVPTSPFWSPGPFILAFRPDNWTLLYLHSALSLVWTLLVFEAMAILTAVAARGVTEPRGLAELTRAIAGWPARRPVLIGLLTPGVLAGVLWALLAGRLARLGVMPRPASSAVLLGQSCAVALSVWLPARWLVLTTLLLRLFQNYVYVGENPFWDAVRAVGRAMEWPWNLLPLQLGRMDFTPLVAAGAVWGVGEAVRAGLAAWCNVLWR